MTRPAAARSWLPLAAVATTLVTWASAFVAIRHLGQYFSPGPLTLGRTATGAVALGVLAATRRAARPAPRHWWRLVVIGVLWYAVYNVSLNAGEQRVDAGTAALVLQSAPVFLAVLAALVLGESFTARLGLGLLVCLCGVTLIATGGGGAGGGDLLGVALCVVPAAAYAVSAVVQKPLVADLPAAQVTWLACTIGAAVCLPWTGRLAEEIAAAPASATAWVVYLGVVPTALGFTCYAYALRFMAASSLGVTTYLVPVVTIVLAWLLLGEVPAGLAVVGGLVTLAGVALARSRPRPARSDARAV